jgi:hypothetical protein
MRRSGPTNESKFEVLCDDEFADHDVSDQSLGQAFEMKGVNSEDGSFEKRDRLSSSSDSEWQAKKIKSSFDDPNIKKSISSKEWGKGTTTLQPLSSSGNTFRDFNIKTNHSTSSWSDGEDVNHGDAIGKISVRDTRSGINNATNSLSQSSSTLLFEDHDQENSVTRSQSSMLSSTDDEKVIVNI